MKSPILTYEHLLTHYAGGAGCWQWKQFTLIMLQSMVCAVPFFMHLFSTFTPPHRCMVQECEDPITPVFNTTWIPIAIPLSNNSHNFLKADSEMNQCQRFAPSTHISSASAECTAATFDTSQSQPCTNYVYDQSVFEATLTTELNLVCNKADQVSFIGTVMMFGLLTGSFLSGPLGDKLGRRKALVGAMCIQVPMLLLEGFSTSYYMFISLRFIEWNCSCILWVTGHALGIELFDASHRKLPFVINNACYFLFALIMVTIAYFERHWSNMHLCAGVLALAIFPITYFFLRESTRWLILNGREEAAKKQLREVAAGNGKVLSEQDIRDISGIIDIMAAKERRRMRGGQNTNKILQATLALGSMFKPPLLQRTLVLLLIWSTSVTSYYALALNATKLAGNIFLNIIFSSLADLPCSLFIYVMLDYSRRISITISLGLLGLCCIIMAFIPKDQTVAVLVLFMVDSWYHIAAWPQFGS